MKYHELQISKHKNPKRVGRGIAAGQGKTAGRGTKGQKSRTGSSRKPGFEGGQTPLIQRLPKLHGFRSFKVPAEVVYTGQLNDLKAKTIDTAALAEAGLISNPYVKVKLLAKGDIAKSVAVKLQAASEAAVAAVKKAGGSFEQVSRVGRSALAKKQEIQTEKRSKA
jgi:large subunit ribosomal protein L15